ncbi:hypothetical protein [Pedobacter sp. MW01-1-1]|uniref:hypothetical protein n=1 Tax=Pedobacter sp. MW01-1-1 TaxID=3383027 RepID=UPI003FF0A2A1
MFKSIKTSVVALILVSTAIIAHAQKKITEGTITYTLSYNLTAEQKPYEAALPSEMKLKFNNGLTKIEMEHWQ